MFDDVHHFVQLKKILGAQEYLDKFKSNFGHKIDDPIMANNSNLYNPEKDVALSPGPQVPKSS
jgi:hypothetical protein